MEINGVRQGIVEVKEKEDPYLIGTKCNNCSYISFPQKEVCPNCLTNSNYEKILFGKKGSISNVTFCHTAPKGFNAPYALGLIKTTEGVEVLSQIDGNLEELEKNKEVELTIAPTAVHEDGSELLGWKYKLEN